MQIDAVSIIKDSLTMREILEQYGFRVKRRIPCPIHNGHDANFEVKEKEYVCYSHCGSGDVISFVQKLFNLSFPDTLKKIDTDFRLNIYGEHSFEDVRRSFRQQQELKAKRDRERRQKELAENEYWKVFDEWKRLDNNKRDYAPRTHAEEWNPLFVEALQKLPYQLYLLEMADIRRHEHE